MRQFLVSCGLGGVIFGTSAAIRHVGWLPGLICGGLLFWFVFCSLAGIFLGKGATGGCAGAAVALAVLIGVPLLIYMVEIYVVDDGKGGVHWSETTNSYVETPGGKHCGPGGDYVADKIMDEIGKCGKFCGVIFMGVGQLFFGKDCSVIRACFVWAVIIFIAGIILGAIKGNQNE